MNYDKPYPYKGGEETPRQHIINGHINAIPTLFPPVTVYTSTFPMTANARFSLVQGYNATTLLLGTFQDQGGAYVFDYTFPATKINLGIGTLTIKGIGLDGADNVLSTNHLVLTPGCAPITSYATKP